jgi:hypothetical protein
MVRPSGLTATACTQPYGLQGAQQAPALGLPHLHRAVIRPADDEAPVGADRHGPHPIRMAFQGAQQAPALGSHTFTVRSSEPLTMKRPSGLTATPVSPNRMAFQGAQQAPAFGSHTFTVRSAEPLTMKRPSGLTATARTLSVWPSRERSRRPLSAPTPSPCGHRSR